MASSKPPTVERRVFMGIGDAVLRLIHVERMYADGVDPSDYMVAERDLIVQALNQQYQLDLGMDCDMDGIPDAIDDDVTMLTAAAQTSCCRILPEDGSRSPAKSRVEPLPDPVKKAAPKKAAPKKAAPKSKDAPKRRTSRKKAAPPSTRKKASAKKTTPTTPTKKKGLLSTIFGSDEEDKK